MTTPRSNAAVRLTAAADLGVPPVPRVPITHQPVVGVSLVLIAATCVQIVVYLVNAQFLARAGDIVIEPPSPLVASGQTYEWFTSSIERMDVFGVPAERVSFSVLLVLTILSSVGWYTVGRKFLGPAWAIACGGLWAGHPLFGFLAQRPSPLTLCLVCVPFAWAVILWWYRSGRRRVAFLAGLLAGASTFVSLALGLAFVLSVPVLFATGRVTQRRPWPAFALIWLGFLLPMLVAAELVRHSLAANPLIEFQTDLLRVLEDESTPVAPTLTAEVGPTGATSELSPRRVLALLSDSVKRSPFQWIGWLSGRAWRTVYATADGHFERPLFAVQMAVMLPAVWGAVVCLRQSFWRWPAIAGLILLGTHWLMAMLVEPLARSLAPAGGVIVLFALVGVVDLYERAFGRQLQAPG
ncbi:MAG TPA: hypothetical protein PL151_01775 [Phycisphaerae bacterium]|nr:hypothetical protein [Phycisphaerae bacterium]HOJ73939.1 hypothetical protein [Phycisphaerae bacterium]HOM50880.1 hypothetical protein [Phycisphaerae bacterium]HOQ88411.1 hypothetical protein [Phycisphaerae bacterium]HPP25945.1 hypothetical protein [Phycisphaerae bacterium]